MSFYTLAQLQLAATKTLDHPASSRGLSASVNMVSPIENVIPRCMVTASAVEKLPEVISNPSDNAHRYPANGDWRFAWDVSSSAKAKVDAIQYMALSHGWNERSLYQNRGEFRFPCGGDYGLICFVSEHDRIGAVTREYIEIIGPPPRNICQRFYNPDVDHPWMKKVQKQENIPDTFSTLPVSME